MKKKLLKFAIIILIFFIGPYFAYANEIIILPKKKPLINNEKN